MESISESELDALPVDSIVQRMDEFLVVAQRERYGTVRPSFPLALPSELVNTVIVRQRSEDERRKIAYVCFSYLVQLELDSVSSGMANKILYTPNYDLSHWHSPAFRLRDGALRQYETICSRIAFEIFIDLLHVIETGQRLDSKKSKLKAFRIWLQES